MRARRVAAELIRAKSIASCTELAANRANPVCRAAITSLWSPKMDKPWAAKERAAMCNTVGVSSPAILYRLGIINNSPWEAVKVVVSAPDWSAPCTAPAAPASDCISMTVGTCPHRFGRPSDDHWSDHSPIGEAGVMG